MQRNYVTIVSGLPRSGTSMMMQMVDRGGMAVLSDGQRRADEDNPRGYYEFEPVKKTKQDPSWLTGAVGKAVKMVHLLLLDLPLEYAYRVVFMRRDLSEVVRSQNIMLERKGQSTNDLPAERLVEIYRLQLNQVNRYLAEHEDRFRVLEVNYNEMLRNPRPQVEAIAEFLDGLDTGGMLDVVDPALYRNRAAS